MNTALVATASIRRDARGFFEYIRARLSDDGRLVTFYGRAEDDDVHGLGRGAELGDQRDAIGVGKPTVEQHDVDVRIDERHRAGAI